jgi:hypothetical protein
MKQEKRPVLCLDLEIPVQEKRSYGKLIKAEADESCLIF